MRQAQSPPPRPSALLAGLLSLLLPGSGQLYAGRRLAGAAILALAALVGGAVVWAWWRGPLFVLRWLVDPDVLLTLLVALTVAFVLHVACILHAYAVARRRRQAGGGGLGRTAGQAASLLLLVALAALPYTTAAYYDFASYDLLTSVFADEEPVELAQARPPATVRAVATPAAASKPAASEGGAIPADPATGPALHGQVPAAATSAYWQSRGRLNLLLVGGDAGPGRVGLRTDTIIVLSVNLKRRRAAFFSVPRNLESVPLPARLETGLDTFPDLLNALWGYAEAHLELVPGAARPGAAALKATVGNLLGLRVDYYAAVDLRGFVEMVDALHGVTVTVQSRVYDAGVSPAYEGEPWTAVDLAPGRHHLDGRTALAYVRTRWATSDYDRMHRQRCLLGDLVEQASVPKLLRAFPRLVAAVKRYVETDIPRRALPDLIELVGDVDTKHLVGVSFVPPRFSPVADVADIRATVQAALRASPPLGEETGLRALAADCA